MYRKLRLFCKQCIMCVLGKRTNWINDENYNRLIYRAIFGRWPDLKHPRTFNEYIISRKVFLDEYDLWKYTDKYEVRVYVERVVGTKYLNQVLGVFESFEEIDFSKLPNQFVLKGTHGSGYNVIVPDKKGMDMSKARRSFRKWLSEDYYYKGREKNYHRIKPRIVCESYISMPTEKGLPEFKVFCFNGVPRFFAHNMMKNGRTLCNMYSADCILFDMKKGYGNIPNSILPENMEELLRVARSLARPFPFVRVDLYNVNGKIIFSELTFHSGGGYVPFTPESYDVELGHFFKDVPMRAEAIE